MKQFIQFLKHNYNTKNNEIEILNLKKEINVKQRVAESYLEYKIFKLIDDYLVIENKINIYQNEIKYSIFDLDINNKTDDKV
jgi:hypothetical protein